MNQPEEIKLFDNEKTEIPINFLERILKKNLSNSGFWVEIESEEINEVEANMFTFLMIAEVR